MMDQIAKMNDSFATLMNESVQVETVSTTSASEDTDESAIESQSDDENAREQETNGKPRLMKQISTTGFLEDLPLHSLETDQYGPSVQKYISKYLDDDLNTFLLNKKSKKEKGDKDSLLNTQQSARTIKAATKHIDAQGKRAISKHSSLSSVNLSCHSSVTPPPTPNYDFGADQSVAFGKQKPPSPSTTIISVLESQMLQEKEAVSPFREYDRRKHRKRQVNKLRIQERDAKGEIDGENSSHASASIEPKSQFSCLPARPNHNQIPRKNISITNLKLLSNDCPADRLHFYKTFAQTVKRGKRGCGNGFATSSIGNDIDEIIFKQELRDLIWLEMKSWMSGRSMIDQDSWLCAQRLRIPSTLERVINFSVVTRHSRRNSYTNSTTAIATPSNEESVTRKGSQDQANGSSDNQNDLRALIEADKLAASVALKLTIHDTERCSSPVEISSPMGDDDCNCSETLSRLCQSCVDKESEALEQVNNVLQELEEAELLYPCTKAFASDYPAYVSEPLSSNIKSLNLFVNITRDMREKVDLLAKLFHITNRRAAGWPVYETEEIKEDSSESADATPEIRQENYGYSYRLNAHAPLVINQKQVSFKPGGHLMARDCNSSQNSDRTVSAPDSPDVQMPHSPTEHSSSSKGSSGPSMFTHQNLFFSNNQSIYRRYVDKALKHKGLRYIYHQISHIIRPLLYRVHAALKKPSTFSYADAVASHSKLTVSSEHLLNKKQPPVPREYCEELSLYGVWSPYYQQMALPTFHRPFLFILRVTVDVVHECLKIRLEQLPDQPSAVSVGQLIRECKEVIRAGVQIRQRYVNLAHTVLGEGGSDIIEAQLDSFDDDLKTMLSIYLKYLEQYMFCMQANLVSQSSNTLRQKGYLEEEWNFVRTFCPHIPDGEAMAANRFCQLASDLLASIGDNIQTSIDECFVAFNESIAAAPLNMSVFRKSILSCCRKFKHAFQEAAGRACQATAFAKSLRKDLEIASEFHCITTMDLFLERLKETGHIRVFAPNCPTHVMFVPNHMHGNEPYIWQLVNLTCGGRGIDIENDIGGYLVVTVCQDKEIHWSGTTIILEPTAESTFSLSHVQVDGVMFIVNQPSRLELQSQHFKQIMYGTLDIYKQQTACNHAIASALEDLKDGALEIHNKISHSLNLIYDQVDVSRFPNLDDNEKSSLQGRCLDVINQGFKFAFEYQKALTRLITGELKIKLAKQLVSFAMQWIKFVVTKCEKGRGMRSRWSNQGLQYLLIAFEPQYLQALTDDEYLFLRCETERFLAHIGCDKSIKTSPVIVQNVQGPYSLLVPTHSNKPLASSLNFQRSQSVNTITKNFFGDKNGHKPLDVVMNGREYKGTRLEEWARDHKPASQSLLRVSLRKSKANDSEACIRSPRDRMQRSIVSFDEKRRRKLQEQGRIGDISDLVIHRTPLQITARKVNFTWQRGFKIGEGRFGKVYTAVNTKTGELIAMKEIHLQPNDQRAVKETIDEIKTFEGIKHKNLVRYYGVEIHREDLYIFMEYCNEGTLESAVQLQLPEQLVRKYTRHLLEAVNVLHENGIVHRDIKSANIFLTSDGNLKLGDFGCCMKLKNQTTMAGELNAFVGTAPYMAPEIFTKNAVEGHGRAADIWSIGCVVLEMLTGRRPWHDVDNSYQIMFKVGMGETPEVPEDLCEEGHSFISCCLLHDPKQRLSSGQLLCHPFTKVEDDDAVV